MISDIPFQASMFMLAGSSVNNEIRATDIVKLEEPKKKDVELRH